ncbi:Glycoside hydrolase family 47 [Penicillium coprophilum]|uniref:Glycoside hydrolase family 47 n=1 Tax=Penicillium coprophilum TaxID=36646 RepID=UPI0023926F54|nr:Glycoside hydrolase family 47 [Penicillium coprophilum]KAJ5162557.1 Glycoside hydrolase family 47 [Penicillium coprophilum]
MRISSLSLPLAVLSLVGPAAAYPYPESEVVLRHDSDKQAKADAVKEAFQHAWNGYVKYAFPHDELHPVSNGYGDSRNGWGASAVDALSTAIIMGNREAVQKILDHIETIDFSKTKDEVSLFETTIRYLGGHVDSAANLALNSTQVDTLLIQSKKLGDVLKFAFDTPSGVPYNNLDIESKGNDGSRTNGLAVTGTLVLEWTRLSDLTGDEEYAQLSQKAQSYLLNPQPSSGEPFPGLVGSNINISNGHFTDSAVSWNGGDDSFYEYLIKMYVYDPKRFKSYKDRWVLAAESTIQHLQSHPAPRPEITWLASYNNGQYDLSSQHLTCFDGGSFILGGTVLARQDFIDFGLQLVDGCEATYNQTLTGIGPDSWGWDPKKVPSDQKDFYEKAGFYINSGAYVLRPEVIESFYYAYRVTGNEIYRDWVWNGFKAINSTCRTGSGFAAVSDVNTAGGGSKYDNEESFLFAEVLKYAYLVHAEDAPWQVQKGQKNEFVFNTEAHPMRVAPT